MSSPPRRRRLLRRLTTAACALALAVTTVLVAPVPAFADQLDQPTNVHVSPGRRAITASWSAPSGLVDHYIATTSPGGYTCKTASASGCTINGLVGATTYTVSVVACPTADDYGPDCSEPSDPSGPALTGPPNVPTSVTAAYTGTGGEVAVSWAETSSLAGVETYRVTSTPAVTTPSGTCASVVASSATTCVYGGLTAGTSYTFRVTAVGVTTTGTSAASSATSAIVAGPPGSPGTPTVAYSSDTAVDVTWSASTPGGPLSGYTVLSTPTVGPPAGCTAVPTSTLTCTFTGLDAATSYTFRVQANGTANSGTTLSAASPAIVPGKPGTPGKPVATVTSDGDVTVGWAASTGGAPVTGYTVTAAPGGATCTTGSVSCSISGLVDTQMYTFTVTAAAASGSAVSAASDAVMPGPPAAPDAPTAAVTGSGSVTVTWPASTLGGQVSGYTVTSSPGGNTCTTVTAAGLSCTVSGLTTSTTYTFSVVANGPGGDSASSVSSNAVVPGAPAAPAKPTVVLGASGEATVNWSTPSGGAPTGYSVAATPALTPPASGLAACQDALVLSCHLTGLSPTTSYTFTVTAANAVGSATSVASDAVVPGVPGKPGTPTVVVAGSGHATLHWTASTGGGAVTGYSVTSNPAVTEPACTNITTLTCTFASLDPAQSYTFTVTATGAVSPPTASDASASVTAGPPTAPGTPAVTITTSGQATVTWAAATGGGAVTSYSVTSNPLLTAPAGCTTTTNLTCTFTGLDPQTPYTFTVTATGLGGTSPASAASTPAVPGVPGVPGTPTVLLGTSGRATVSWTAATGGGAVTGYSVVSSPSVTAPAGCTNTLNLSCVFTNLDPDTSYTFTVTAIGTVGTTSSAGASAAVIPGAPHAPATAPTVLPSGSGTVTVTWPASSGGGQLTGYSVTSNPSVTAPGGCTNITDVTCSFTGLDPATPYTFTVTATGPVGSATSASSVGVVPGPPHQPGLPTAVSNSAGTVTVSWAAPVGGGAVTGYSVTSDPVVTPPSGCTNISLRTCVFTGLDPATSYVFTVTASGLVGPPSTAVSAAVTPGAPTSPGTPTVASSVSGTATVTWTAPSGGGLVTGYSVTSDPVVTPPAGCTNITALTCTFTGLNPATSYAFRVTATGLGGASLPSSASARFVPGAPGAPGTPGVVSTTPGVALVSWTASSGGGALTGYSVTSDPVVTAPAGCTATHNLSCTFAGLNPATSYTFKVTAIGPVDSADSAPSAAMVPGPPRAPGTPTLIVARSGQVTVSWTAPSGGAAVDSYSVTSTPSVGPPAGCTNITALTCTFTGLTPATSYTFTVTATGSAGATDSLVSAAVVPGAPTAPGTPTVVSSVPGEATVSWRAPSGGGVVTGYTVTPSPSATVPNSCLNTQLLTCTFTGLDQSQTYVFTVIATGLGGDSPPSNPSAGFVPGAPGAPGTPVVVSTTPGLVLVSWAPSGGGAVTGYTVTSDPSATAPAGCTDTRGLTCTYVGLDTGTPYRFKVTATGPVGSTGSAWSVALVPGPPGAPGTPTVATSEPGQATVSWTAPSSGGAVTSYSVTSNPPVPSANCTNTTALTCMFTGLDPRVSYTFRVTAKGPAGVASSYPSLAAVPGAPGVPGTPTVANAGLNQVTVSWTAPIGGAAITGYRVTSSPAVSTDACANITALTCLFTGLDPATSYTFTVTADGTAGSTDSAPSAAVFPGAPGAPTDVQVAPAARQIAVSWTAPADLGIGIARYRATASPGGAQCITANSTDTDCVITGVQNLTSYTVTVTAIGLADPVESAASTASVRVRPTAGIPGSPTGVQAAIQSGAAVVTWTAPTTTGNGIARYTVTATGPDGSHTCVTSDGNTLTCTVTGLTNMATYQVVVVAIGKAASGNSIPSTAISVMPAAVPDAPTGVRATTGARNLTVTFTPGGFGNGVLSYTATATGGTTPLTCTVATITTPCVISGLTPGTSYTVTVVANSVVNGLTSAASAPSSAVVAVNAPAPTLPAAQPSSGGAMTSSAGSALRVNGVTTITGTGWAPYTGISVGIYPGPVSLGTAVTDSTGAFSLSVTIPFGTTLGGHVIVAGGLLSTNTLRYKTLTTSIAAANPLTMQRSGAGRPVAEVRRAHLAVR